MTKVMGGPPALQRLSFEEQAYAGSVYIKQSMEQVHSLPMYTLRGLEGTAWLDSIQNTSFLKLIS